MSFNMTGSELFWGLLGGFFGAYLCYFLISFFFGKFTKWDQGKIFKISLGITTVLLFTVSTHTWTEKLLFYSPPIVNIFIMEYLATSKKKCPHCGGKNKKTITTCVHCGKNMPS
ncbi:MAG: hypothetical protein MJA84_00240 [Firmicutes bacterium]|nr:hypothetical protein [Bacillota bacterium]